MLMNATKAHRSPRDERGFSLIIALVVLSVSTLLLFGAIDAVFQNAGPTRDDLDQKRALLAADAGLSTYVQALNANPNFWQSCPVSGATGASGSTGTPVTVPGSTDPGSTETYTYEGLPATGQTGCNAANPIGSMIETSATAAAGTFRVKFTGTSQPTTGTARIPISRSLVAQFNAANFLQYVYFTNYEIEDPAATNDNVTTCSAYYSAARNSACGGPIYFISADTISGPMHSNDDLAVSGSPTFGSTTTDAIETPGCYTSTNATPSIANCGTNVVGTINTTAHQPLLLPTTNSQLEQVADGNIASPNSAGECYPNAGCVFMGPTTIQLTGSTSAGTFSVTNALYNNGQTTTGLRASNGVIYVANPGGAGSCTVPYTPYIVNSSTAYTYGVNSSCGNATIIGPSNYSTSMTIDAANDVLIDGNIEPTSIGNVTSGTPPTPSGTAVLGLIATDFVRVEHPLTGTRPNGGGCPTSGNTNATGSNSNLYVYAAILALTHSFIVDNFDCGTPLGTLNVYGVIAQNFRGPVGTESGSSVASGYTKDYDYDWRFQALSPPYFLNPVNAGWEVNRLTECDNKC
jgi:Tfp pilus assembly protein PilX